MPRSLVILQGSRVVVSYIFSVAVLNICLGFALAAYLGRRYRLLAAPALRWMPETAPAGVWDDSRPSAAGTVAAAKPAPVAPAESSPAAPVAAAASLGQTQEEASLSPCETAPQPQKPPGEESVVALRHEVGQYEDQVAQSTDALRSYTGVADAAAIEACLSSLVDATNEYLRHREELQKGFQRLPEQPPKLQEIHAKVQVAIDRQDTQIQSAADSIAKFNYQDDLEAGCIQVVGETSKLMDANHHLRDTLDVALVEVARSQQRLHVVDCAAQNDPLTGLTARAGVEAQLCQWWEDDPQRVRYLSVAMIDIDHFTEINQHVGHKAGDKFLRAVGQLLLAERDGEGTAARFTGQCFLLLFPDSDVRLATNSVEKIRQTLDMAHFRCRDEELRLTVSCAVTGTTAQDTTETLLARAEEALREAKRYGRNRTFLYEGKYPTPVVPPTFSLEEREITL